MNRIILVLVLLAAGGAGLGFYLGWFHVGTESGDGKSNITFSVDKDKVHKDTTAAEQEAQQIGNKIRDSAAGPTEKSKD